MYTWELCCPYLKLPQIASSWITRYHASFTLRILPSGTSLIHYIIYPVLFDYLPPHHTHASLPPHTLQADPELHIAIFDHDDVGVHDFLGDASLKVPAGT
jgi:hypothetical protein